MTTLDDVLVPGTGVFWSQACGEPTTLVDAVLDRAADGMPLRAFVGLTWHDRLASDLPDDLAVVSYGALGGLRRLARDGRVEVVACRYSDVAPLLVDGSLPGEVALVQVSPPGPDGTCSLGVEVGYVGDALAGARMVVAEVNAAMPATTGGPRLSLDAFDVVVETDRPLVTPPQRDPDDVDRAIATRVAELVDDGDTLQFGVGTLPDAVAAALTGHHDLGIHSGMVTDTVVDLVDAGAVTGARTSVDAGVVVTGSVIGTDRVMDRLDDLPIEVRPVSATHDPRILARMPELVAVNGAVQVDLTGQVNAEVAGGAPVGAVGGQPEFARAASLTGRRSIIMLRSTMRGRSTIVAATDQGVVTTPRTDVDVVVTEHGVAWLRGRSPAARQQAMLAIAGPEHRDDLARDLFDHSPQSPPAT